MKQWERELARVYGLAACARCGEAMDATRDSDNCTRCEGVLLGKWIGAALELQREEKRNEKLKRSMKTDDIVKRVFGKVKMEKVRDGRTWAGVTTWNEAQEVQEAQEAQEAKRSG